MPMSSMRGAVSLIRAEYVGLLASDLIERTDIFKDEKASYGMNGLKLLGSNPGYFMRTLTISLPSVYLNSHSPPSSSYQCGLSSLNGPLSRLVPAGVQVLRPSHEYRSSFRC